MKRTLASTCSHVRKHCLFIHIDIAQIDLVSASSLSYDLRRHTQTDSKQILSLADTYTLCLPRFSQHSFPGAMSHSHCCRRPITGMNMWALHYSEHVCVWVTNQSTSSIGVCFGSSRGGGDGLGSRVIASLTTKIVRTLFFLFSYSWVGHCKAS